MLGLKNFFIAIVRRIRGGQKTQTRGVDVLGLPSAPSGSRFALRKRPAKQVITKFEDYGWLPVAASCRTSVKIVEGADWAAANWL